MVASLCHQIATVWRQPECRVGRRVLSACNSTQQQHRDLDVAQVSPPRSTMPREAYISHSTLAKKHIWDVAKQGFYPQFYLKEAHSMLEVFPGFSTEGGCTHCLMLTPSSRKCPFGCNMEPCCQGSIVYIHGGNDASSPCNPALVILVVSSH